MRRPPIITLLFLLFFFACDSTENVEEAAETIPSEAPAATNPGHQLVLEMITASGGLDRWRALEDLEYTYTYKKVATGEKDVSLDRYFYDGELSWAKYTNRDLLFPDLEGEMIQAYNGDTTWVTLNGDRLTDPQVIKRSDFLRKTTFYWLNMMYKLADPEVNYEMGADKAVNGIDYKTVKITFDEHVGDAQDTYLLYINPETKLVDQFLFTIMDFGVVEPFLMLVEYEEVGGLKWPVNRRYAPANWEGNLVEGAPWTEATSENIKLNNGFSRTLFQYKES